LASSAPKACGNSNFRTILWKRSKKKQKEAGWWTDERSKEAMFSELNRSVKTGDVLLRSDVLVKECGQYVRDSQGPINHVGRVTTEDAFSASR
jgi:hypothetical protein